MLFDVLFDYREVDNPGKEIEMRVLRYLLLVVVAVFIFILLIFVCGTTGVIAAEVYFIDANDVVHVVLGFAIGAVVGFFLAALVILVIWWAFFNR